MSHTPFRYVPGRATALASTSVGVLLGADAEHPAVDGLLEALDEGAGVDDVLDVLLRGGLRGLPDFACAQVTDAGVRVVVRGGFTAVPEAGDPIRAVSGPWADAVVPGASVVLRGPDAAAGRRMPFHGGVVLAAELVVAATDARAVRGLPAVAAAPAVAPVSEVPQRAVPEVPHVLPEELPPVPEVPEAAQPPAPVPTLDAAPTADTPTPAVDSVTLAPDWTPVDEVGEQLLDFDFLFAAPSAAQAPASDEPPAEEPPAEEPIPADPIVADPAMTSPAVVTAHLPFLAPGEAPASGGLIECLPWERPPAASLPPHTSPPAQASSPETTPPAAALPVPGVSEDLGSRTINRSQLLRAAVAPQTVLAARCPHGHLSPAFAAGCRVCRTPIPPQQHFETPRPTLGVLRLSTGATVTLDRGAILGRNPRVPADHQGAQPNLVKVVDPGRDLSGQHLEVALDFWNVVVRDLGSTNGTEVVLPGEMPVSLAPNQPMILEPGSKVVMAGTVSFVFEATP